MNTSGDAAEQVVRLSLEGFEVAAKITGSGAKNVAALLYAIMKDKQKTAGKTNLTNMLKSGKELNVFSVRNDEFKKFAEEAKRYGVLYSALINRKTKANDGIIDIMVRSEDAAKINRIVERFKLASYDEVSIRSEIEKTRESKKEKSPKDIGIMEKSKDDKNLDELAKEPLKKEKERRPAGKIITLPLPRRWTARHARSALTFWAAFRHSCRRALPKATAGLLRAFRRRLPPPALCAAASTSAAPRPAAIWTPCA